jgi:cytochrome c oxidase subunit 1
VYVLILPAFGILGAVLPTFARKPLFAYKTCVGAILSLAVLGMIVWAHHQYTVGMSRGAMEYFMIVTIIISIPIGLLVFNYLLTIWRGAMTFETPMLFALSVIVLFGFGGLTGVMLAVIPADLQYQDSMFVVAHFHYVLLPGAFFGLVAGVLYWLPKWTGHMYDERLAKWFFWLAFIGFNLTFFVQHFLGLAGMPRRIIDYNVQFAEFNFISSVGAFIFGASHLIFLWLVIKCIRGGKKATDEVWEGTTVPGNRGLEWTLPSPPPFHTFTTAPKVG